VGDGLGLAELDGDGFADLAAGVRDEALHVQRVAIKDAGAANVLYGSAAGLSADGNQFWTQDSPGVRDKAETDDRFSTALSTGDFNTDGFDELVVGVRHEDVGDIVDAGIANALYGTASGLSATGNQLWSQDTFGVKDEAEAG